MNATLPSSIDQIRSTVDPSSVLLVNGEKSKSLANQIQLSSLLKTFVETPQEALAAVEGSKNRLDRSIDKEISDTSNNNRVSDRGKASHNISRSNSHSENIPIRDKSGTLSQSDKPKLASSTKDELKGATTSISNRDRTSQADNQSDNFSTNPTNSNAGVSALVSTPDLMAADAPKNAENAANSVFFNQQVKLMNTVTNKSLSLNPKITQAENTPTQPTATTDQILPDAHEDVLTAVHRGLSKSAGKTLGRPGSHTVANLQSQDIAQRLGQESHLKIQVITDGSSGKQVSIPTQALIAGTQFPAVGLTGEGNNLLGNNLNRLGSNVATDRQIPNSHVGAQNNGGAFNTQSESAASNFAQVIRTQALATQQKMSASTPKITTATADISNISNPSGPANLNQLTQTIRTGTNFVPKQPQMPPPPMEQVSVQIQKAVINGANKVSIKLHPANLGRVEVRLEIATDGQLSAIITAEKPETLELLQRDIRGLEKSLQQAGLDANANSFNFGLKKNPGRDSNPDRGNDGDDDKLAEDSAAIQNGEINGDNLIGGHIYDHNLTTNGGIDIQV